MIEVAPQGTAEWLAARCGKATASRVADATAKTKSGWGSSRANYRAELVVEQLTGVPYEQHVSAAMQWGIDTEAQARAAYSRHSGREVAQVGFVPHPQIDMAGASPDGLVGADGLAEFKCPNSATHIDTLLGTSIDLKYIKQMQFQMACAERSWCDWVSFDPRLPEGMQIFVQRVRRDAGMIHQLEMEIAEFLQEVAAKVAALTERYGRKEAA